MHVQHSSGGICGVIHSCSKKRTSSKAQRDNSRGPWNVANRSVGDESVGGSKLAHLLLRHGDVLPHHVSRVRRRLAVAPVRPGRHEHLCQRGRCGAAVVAAAAAVVVVFLVLFLLNKFVVMVMVVVVVTVVTGLSVFLGLAHVFFFIRSRCYSDQLTPKRKSETPRSKQTSE